MYIYQGLKRSKRGGEGDFPTVYMLIPNLTALVLELFILKMLIVFLLIFFAFFLLVITLDCRCAYANMSMERKVKKCSIMHQDFEMLFWLLFIRLFS